MGNLELVTLIIIGINAVVSLKGFNDALFFVAKRIYYFQQVD